MEREQIIKALECCCKSKCSAENNADCPLINDEACACTLPKNALSLINELTEENERLKELCTTKEVEKELVRRQTKAETLRKMQERLNTVFYSESKYMTQTHGYIRYIVDKISKEMLEESNG